MIIDTAQQNTDEWFHARSGVVTASNFAKVMSKGRGKAPSLTRMGYMRKLATEIITERPVTEDFKSKWMEGGNEREAESREYYTIVSKNTVDQVGLIYLNELKRIGASVDGLIGGDGQQELKNPKLVTHVGYLLDDVLPATYKKQVQGQLWVTGREWCDFASYHPDSHKMIFIKRVERDDDFIKEISEAVYQFIGELDVLVEKMRTL